MPANVMAVTAASVALGRVNDSWAWYTIRASGLVALALLVLLMLSGIGHVTGWTYRVLPPVKAWAVHKAMAIMLALSVLVHVGSLLIDHYVPFNVAEVLVPFAKNYSNGTKLFGLDLGVLAVPAGITAAYGVMVVTLSSFDTVGWIKRHRRLWKVVHTISYLVILAALFHALSVGTDFKGSLLRTAAIVTGVVLVLAIAARLRRLKLFTKSSALSGDE